MKNFACINKAKIFAVVTAGVRADHEEVFFWYNPRILKLRQRTLLAISCQRLADKNTLAEELSLGISGKHFTWSAANFFDQLIESVVQHWLGMFFHFFLAPLKNEIIAIFDFIPVESRHEKKPMVE